MAYWMHLTPSEIDKILKKESFTVHELLEEDDLVQECKCCNQALMDFLVKPEVMTTLLKLMTQPEVDHPKAKLYSKKAADVFLCEITSITEGLIGNPENITTLLDFLEQPLTGDCGGDLSLAGYFCRVMLHLCDAHAEEMSEVLSSRENVFQLLLSKLSFDSFRDLLLPLLLAQNDDSYHLVSCWMWENNVVNSLLEILKTTDDLEMHVNAAALLRETVEAKPQVLTELSQPDNLKLLVSLLEGEDDEKVANILCVLSGVVADGKDAVDEFATSPASTSDTENAVGIIAGAMEMIARLLDRKPEREIEMPGHTISPVVGKMRLQCLEFLALVVRAYKTGAAASSIHSGMIEHQLLPRVVQLLFDHPWHNILHIYIDDVIQHCLYSTNDDLRTALIDQCSLHTKLAEALDASVAQDATKPGDSAEDGTFDPTKSSASNASAASDVSVALTRSCRTGNMGLVVGLAQALSEAADNHDCLSSRLESDTAWKASVSGALAEEIQKQSVELGRSEYDDPMSQMQDICSSSSEDEQHYIHHSSSDEDEDGFTGVFEERGGQNNIVNAFSNSDTTFVDDSNAWSSGQIAESEWTTSSDWLAEGSGLNSDVRNDSGGANDFSMVEDPWADQAPEEIEPQDSGTDWGAGPAWEANFGNGAGPAWNACFEPSPETVEGSMIEEAPTPDEPVPEAASEAEASDAVVDDTVSDDSKEAVPEEVELPEEVLENEEDTSVGDV